MWRFKHLGPLSAAHGLFFVAGGLGYLLSLDVFFVRARIVAIVHWYPTAHLRLRANSYCESIIGLIISSRVYRPFRAAKNPQMSTLRLNDEGLRVDGPAGEESFISWPNVRNATESRCLKAVAIWTPNAPAPYLITSTSNTFDDYQSSVDLIRRSVGERWNSLFF